MPATGERRGLAECKFWRMMAPWTQENPIFMHVRQSDSEAVKQAIDQCAAVGFEMVIMTFGSGFKIENDSAAYLQRMKELSDYAAGKGIAIGGYSSWLAAELKNKTPQSVIKPESRPKHAKKAAALAYLPVSHPIGETPTSVNYRTSSPPPE